MFDEMTEGDSLWEKVVQQVKMLLPTEMQRNRMDRYFPLMLKHQPENQLYVIGVEEQIQVEMFTRDYADLIKEALQTNGYNYEQVVFRVIPRDKNQAPAPLPKPIFNTSPTVVQPQEDIIARNLKALKMLHEGYTFENFVRGPSNSFAHAAAIAVAKEPGGHSYNPLFIYGGTGLGKTHLMESIGHYVLAHNPAMSVCCITCENFLNEFVNALANHEMPNFRERFRKFDVLLLDDVQFMAGKPEFQVEFFNTFNSLMFKDKQVVMTCDVAPKDLKGCEERLTGRFQQGMVVEIESPSYETRLAILKSKVSNAHYHVPEEVLKFIAENIRSHVRAIEGALNRVVTFINLNPGFPLTLEITQHLLRDSIEEEKIIKDLTVDEIMRTVAAFYNVKMDEILSKERTQTLVTPRQVAMFLSCKLTTKSLKEIGNIFNKTHATVYHGAQTIQKRLDVEDELKQAMEEITSKLGRKFSDLTA